MRKPYVKPELECLSISSVEDILSNSPETEVDKPFEGEVEEDYNDPWA